MKKKLLVIDTFNFLHRAYHALPKTLTDSKGNPTNAVYGVTSMLINLFNQLKPDYVLAAMDSQEPTFRVEDFTGYKAHRKPMEDALASQIPKVTEILNAFGIKQVMVNGFEADDVIGTVAKEFGEDVEVIIISNDRDLWQLVDKNVVVMVPTKGNGSEWIGPGEVERRMGMTPEQLIDYKALRGDPSDNIPGVYGVGEKTAKKLLDEYGSVEDVYKNIGRVKPDSLREKLANNAEEAVMSKHLATIVTDVPMEMTLDDCKYSDFNRAKVKDVLETYNFKSLIKRLGFESKSPSQKIDENQLSLL
jgi:DNA polymerase-1